MLLLAFEGDGIGKDYRYRYTNWVIVAEAEGPTCCSPSQVLVRHTPSDGEERRKKKERGFIGHHEHPAAHATSYSELHW